METKILIEKCILGDLKAWDIFVKRYEPLVKRGIKYKLNQLSHSSIKSDLNDLSQELFFSIWHKNKLSSLKSLKSLNHWLVMLSINFTSNYCRKTSYQKDLIPIDQPIFENSDLSIIDTLPSPNNDIADTIDGSSSENLINSEIEKLKSKQKLALKLHILDGKTHKEISEIMNIPLSACSTIIRRAKNKIKKKFKKSECK